MAVEAFAVGVVPKINVTLLADDVPHDAILIVHVKTYVPGPPAGVNVAVGLVVLLNCDKLVLGPLLIVHAPDSYDATALALSV